MKKILGLDLGTNSIGWAVVNASDNEAEKGKLLGISATGSRIIPMSADILGDFDKGNSVSQTAERTEFRGVRRLRERNILRRERLLRVLKKMNFLPEHFANQIDDYGKFINNDEPKLAWAKGIDGKFEFIFQNSFNEMLADFAKNQPQLVADGKKVPYDWTIYYLRKKALNQAITKEELAWILLNFNQKRGYYQLRGEEEKPDKLVEFIAQKVVKVEATDEKKNDEVWYNVHLENGLIYRRTSRVPLDWEGKIKEFIVTTDLEKDGSPKKDKDGNIKRSFRAPKEEDWTLVKKKTEFDIDNSHKTVGCYIYDALLQNPNQKIVGKLVRTIERKYYKEELRLILEKQSKLIPELQNDELYKNCIEELYPNNEAHRNNIAKTDFANLFINDIIFYQRPLKSKKSLISDCPYESHRDKDGNEYPIKCIAKSNPFFQEFRLWQFVQNLRIYQREKEVDGKLRTDVDVTNEVLKSEDDYVKLFDWLNDRGSIKQDTLLNSYFKFKKEKGKDQYPYRWNYVEDKEYPCNKTRAVILSKLNKTEKDNKILSEELIGKIWHLLYSVTTKEEIDSVFKDSKREKVNKHKNGSTTDGIFKILVDAGFSTETISKIKNIKFEEKDYGSYSEKAIKKLLPLMRMGKYWSADAIDSKTKERIDKIITGEYDEKIRDRVREKAINLTNESYFRGLPIWLACYIVYDRHSEAKEITKWKKPEDIDAYLRAFKQHSLRNPIVEQVITETLRTVRDIWQQAGRIDEIHVELGREMKNPADKRKKMTETIQQNENTNLRIKAMLMEFMNPEMDIENVRPYSPSQQDILRIYEENALDNLSKDDPEFEFVNKISKLAQPSKSDIVKYKCWLEQKYRSPYTGEVISLAKLFTSAYEIEHIIPQSLYFDDSFSNKVICESEVNKLKSNCLGHQFIKKHHGEKVQISQGKVVEILSVDDYEKFVKDHYSHNRAKMKKLLMDDIPEDFIARQMNDTRYISKVVKALLSNIVREPDEQEATSKNLISCNGNITDRLKKDWGLNDVWNRIVLPRFKRLNELTKQINDIELVNMFKRLFKESLDSHAMGKNQSVNSSYEDYYKSLDSKEQKEVVDMVMKQLPIKESFLSVNNEGHLIPNMPLELQKGFNKKRIDHRHHAMDAIVIACTTRRHVQYLNNENAKSSNYEVQRGLAKELCSFKDVEYHKKEKNEKGVWATSEEIVKKTVPDKLLKPWDTFTQDAYTALQNIIVSFKQNLRVINKTTNYYQHYDENGNKVLERQKKGDSWAIRKSMHKDAVFGEVNLRFTKPVSLNEALKNPQRIVNKEFKQKVQELLAQGRDANYIKKYIDDNKDVWSDIDIKRIDVYYYTKETNDRYFATRFLNELVKYFSGVTKYEDAMKKIRAITDTGIQKILEKHLNNNDNKPEQAFSPDGIDEMNRNIVNLNNGKRHCPIYKVRVYEKSDKKFAIGTVGNKSKKFVEADDGTNLFFAIYESEKIDENGETKKIRSYATIPLNMVIDCQKEVGKQWTSKADEKLKGNGSIEQSAHLLFMLSPNDLVYIPFKGKNEKIDKSRIFVVNDFNDTTIYFRPCNISKAIFPKEVDLHYKFIKKENCEKLIGSYDNKTANFEGNLIKETCIPLKVDRLGKIIEFNGQKL